MDTSPTVLVLDDFPDAAEAIGTWFETQGWRALGAASAAQALSLLSREEITVLVMEPYLREGSAMHVALAARRLRRPPVLIALTWSARSGDHTAYEPTPFDFNFAKPISMPVLSELLSSRHPAPSGIGIAASKDDTEVVGRPAYVAGS
jgi:CheY-like chemotaxis protein